MSDSERVALIRRALTEALKPGELLVKDQSHLHAGHAGARDGLGHFEVHITADAFAGLGPAQRHRLVYDALGDLMRTDIHALSIRARSTDE